MLELTITEELQTLLDKQAITEVLHRYCRGIDRADPETLASAYWPDAYEEHASEYTGPIEGFIEYAMAAVERMHTGHRLSHHHQCAEPGEGSERILCLGLSCGSARFGRTRLDRRWSLPRCAGKARTRVAHHASSTDDRLHPEASGGNGPWRIR